MRRRGKLEILLGAVFGALLGGVVTLSLFMSGLGHWTILTPIALGAVAGGWRGDRAVLGMVKVIGWLP